MRPPAGSARRLAATCSFSRRTSASASNSSLRARRYSLDSPGKWTFGSRSTSRHLFMSRGLPLRAIVSIPFLCSELLPCGDTLRGDTPSFGFAGQSVTAACSVMLAGPTDRIFTDRIFKPPFYERTYIATRRACQCTAEFSKSCGLGWQGRGRRGDGRVGGGAEIAGARGAGDRAARSNSERAAPSACVGRRFLQSAAVRAVFDVDVEDPFEQPGRAHARRRALPERETILLRNFASGAKTPWRIRRPG